MIWKSTDLGISIDENLDIQDNGGILETSFLNYSQSLSPSG